MTKAKRDIRANPRGPGRLTAAETAEMETRLLDCAELVFAQQGFARTSMDAVAKAAGVTRKTLYARFANKSELLEAVVNRLLEVAMAPHRERGNTSPAAGEARQLLLQIARELVGLSEAPHVTGINRLVFAEARQAPGLSRLFLDLHARAVDEVWRVLEMLRDEGGLPRLPDSRGAAVVFVEMVASMPRLRAMLGTPLGRKASDELIVTAVDIFLGGCGKR